jgi:hypothetical protein
MLRYLGLLESRAQPFGSTSLPIHCLLIPIVEIYESSYRNGVGKLIPKECGHGRDTADGNGNETTTAKSF